MDTSSSTVTVRVTPGERERLEAVAAATGRSLSWLAGAALREYLDRESWQVEAIRKGIDDADAGRTVSQKAVRAWVESWDTKRERRRPKCG